MEENNNAKEHPEFPYFGASYPDATCIDGYLWDLDKYEDGQLYGGGDVPCPFCNKEAFMEHEVGEIGDYDSEDEYKEARIRVDGWIQSIEQRYA
jgi:hypothetical protein